MQPVTLAPWLLLPGVSGSEFLALLAPLDGSGPLPLPNGSWRSVPMGFWPLLKAQALLQHGLVEVAEAINFVGCFGCFVSRTFGPQLHLSLQHSHLSRSVLLFWLILFACSSAALPCLLVLVVASVVLCHAIS